MKSISFFFLFFYYFSINLPPSLKRISGCTTSIKVKYYLTTSILYLWGINEASKHYCTAECQEFVWEREIVLVNSVIRCILSVKPHIGLVVD